MAFFMTDIERPRARKDHVCDYCGDVVPAGQVYKRWVSMYDGTASTVKAHVACDDVARDYWKRIDCDKDERWVQWEPLGEWSRCVEDVPAELRALATDWAPGEYERLLEIVTPPLYTFDPGRAELVSVAIGGTLLSPDIIPNPA